MKVKKVFDIPIFSYEESRMMGATQDGRTKVAFLSVKWNLPEMKKYDNSTATFDGEQVKVYDNQNIVIYKTDICAIESFFNKLEEKYTKDVWHSI